MYLKTKYILKTIVTICFKTLIFILLYLYDELTSYTNIHELCRTEKVCTINEAQS